MGSAWGAFSDGGVCAFLGSSVTQPGVFFFVRQGPLWASFKAPGTRQVSTVSASFPNGGHEARCIALRSGPAPSGACLCAQVAAGWTLANPPAQFMAVAADDLQKMHQDYPLPAPSPEWEEWVAAEQKQSASAQVSEGLGLGRCCQTPRGRWHEFAAGDHWIL